MELTLWQEFLIWMARGFGLGVGFGSAALISLLALIIVYPTGRME